MDIFLIKKCKIFIVISILFLCGCGYTTRSAVLSGEASIHVDNFVNKIDVTKEVSNEEIYYAYIPGMESDITREVINRFILDGNYEVRDSRSAHFLLKGQLIDFKRDPLRYDANDNVIEYRLSIVADIELYNLKDDKSVWQEKYFAGESTYRTTGQFAKSEAASTEDAIKDLARRIVERTVENW